MPLGGAARVVLAMVLVWGAVRPAEGSGPSPGAPPACLLAVVDGALVDDTDADALRALLQPPPGRDAARRLAVDAALAHFWLRGYVAPASARGRLEAWRAFLVALRPQARTEDRLGAIAGEALLQLAAVAGLAAGPCLPDATRGPARLADAEARAAPVAAMPRPDTAGLLRRVNAKEPLVRARLLDAGPAGDPCGDSTSETTSGIDLGVVPPGHLDREVAAAALATPPGRTSEPFNSRFGRHVIEVLERFEPGSFPGSSLARALSASPE